MEKGAGRVRGNEAERSVNEAVASDPFVLSTVKTVMKTFTDLSSVLPIQLIYNDSMYCRCPKDCWHVANMFIEQWG